MHARGCLAQSGWGWTSGRRLGSHLVSRPSSGLQRRLGPLAFLGHLLLQLLQALFPLLWSEPDQPEPFVSCSL